ncbi:MAG: glutamine synthetase beta-grasp domain-containing protein [Pseudomonadota bacterium]
MAIGTAEYIWLDGERPTQQLRSKGRVLEFSEGKGPALKDFPEWSYDGSSTYQSPGNHSDLLLVPVHFCIDPLRGDDSYLVLCEVMLADGTPHKSNTRALLRSVLSAGAEKEQPWFGFEQEYVLLSEGVICGFPEAGYPSPQGPYYCGVGIDKAFGREVVESHLTACLEAGLMIYGINAEVLPGQWEFQIGHRGFSNEQGDTLRVTDEMWLARWLLLRIAEEEEFGVTFENKPVKGDWNGSGCHTNFSTAAMRKAETGLAAIQTAVERLQKNHAAHVLVYGDKLEERLTGQHETCSILEFRAGVANRGASVRIPQQVFAKKCGYLEDRRPGANCDPYLVASRLLLTVCAIDDAKVCAQNPNFQACLTQKTETLAAAPA